MRAVVVREPGSAEVLKLEERTIQRPKPGEVLIEVRAFGLNRSELFMVGDRWTLDGFEPMAAIPTAVSLTTYSGGAEDFMATPLQELVHHVEAGALAVKLGPTFKLEEIVEAHRCMEENRATGKIVVLP